MKTPIENFVHRKVAALHLRAPVREAAHALSNRGIACIVIIDSRHCLAGIVTPRDIAGALATGLRRLDEPLSEIMTPDPLTLAETASLEDAVRLMEESGLRRLPVTRADADGPRCVGMVMLEDLIAGEWVGGKALAQIARTRARISSAQSGPPPGRVGLVTARSTPVTLYLLGALVRRLPCTSAAHLIAQLPIEMQGSLWDLPSGPDREITAASIVSGLRARFDLDEASAKRALGDFDAAIGSSMSGGALAYLRAQLPEGLRFLLNNGGHPNENRAM